jgi:NTE family protein
MSATARPVPVANDASGDLAVMLTGGGARAAYQVGLLKGLAQHFPSLRFQIITGVSAGAINAAYLAAHQGTIRKKAHDLERLWCELTCESIYQFDWRLLLPFRSLMASVMPRKSRLTKTRPRAMVDTAPLRRLLCQAYDAVSGVPIRGIQRNLDSGELKSVALMTLDYSTGQTVRWVQGTNYEPYEGANRRSELTRMTVDHVLASSALPFFFPAVRIGDQWHGDGGIRLVAPLSPAVHLGARRILAMSTASLPEPGDDAPSMVSGYPPAAQVLGQLMNAIFLDNIEEDVIRMQRMNDLLRKMAPHERDGLKAIDLMVLRPSVDLGKLAGEYEQYLPREIKLIARALGVKETNSADFLSLVLFEPEYTRRIIDIGESDISGRIAEIRAFLGEEAAEGVPAA